MAHRRVRAPKSGNKLPRGVNRFSERELSRAYRAISKTGAPVDRVEIDPVTGKIAVILARSGAADVDGKPNPWDEVLGKHAANKERAS